MADHDKAIAGYLARTGVTFAAALVGETKRDEWACDEWRVQFEKRAQAGGKMGELKTSYFTGTGHRKSKKVRMPADIARLGPHILARVEWENYYVKPVAPTAASVLYGLLLDADAGEGNFFDFCDNLGYDTDSRKALATYEACCRIRADVNNFFTPPERDQLRAMLEEY